MVTVLNFSFPLNFKPSEGITWSPFFYFPMNFWPSEGLTSAPSFKLILVWVCYKIPICSPFGERQNMAVQEQIYR